MVKDGDTALAEFYEGSIATNVAPFTTAGPHTITVTYTPWDLTYAPSTLTFTVNVAAVVVPVATKVEMTVGGGSSPSSPGNLVVNKDKGSVSACFYFQGTLPHQLAEGTTKWYLDGNLVATKILTEFCDSADLGVFSTLGKHVVRVEYVDNAKFAGSSAESTVEIVNPNPVGDEVARFFTTLSACRYKWFLSILSPALAWMAPGCPWF